MRQRFLNQKLGKRTTHRSRIERAHLQASRSPARMRPSADRAPSRRRPWSRGWY